MGWGPEKGPHRTSLPHGLSTCCRPGPATTVAARRQPELRSTFARVYRFETRSSNNSECCGGVGGRCQLNQAPCSGPQSCGWRLRSRHAARVPPHQWACSL